MEHLNAFEKDIVANPKGHQWVTNDDDGSIDWFAHSVGYCNGPMCKNCGYSFCVHCMIRSGRDFGQCDSVDNDGNRQS